MFMKDNLSIISFVVLVDSCAILDIAPLVFGRIITPYMDTPREWTKIGT